MKIIFAQGNPGEKYSKSRHNIGFMTVDKIVKELDGQWKEKTKLRAYIAEATIDEEKILMVKPTTYYNETGVSARSILDFYKLDAAKDFLVIHDDLSLPLGTIRIRNQGSDAGNNGIKSLNNHIGTQYSRIRIGVWNELRDTLDDAEFVLGNFNKEEHDKLSSTIIPEAVGVIKQFATGTLEYTSHKL